MKASRADYVPRISESDRLKYAGKCGNGNPERRLFSFFNDEITMKVDDAKRCYKLYFAVQYCFHLIDCLLTAVCVY